MKIFGYLSMACTKPFQKVLWSGSIFLLGMFVLTSCDLQREERLMESLEQNYRQLRVASRDAELITSDYVRNMRDSLQAELKDSSSLGKDALATYRSLVSGLDSIELASRQLIDQLDRHVSIMEGMAIINPETGRFQAVGEEDNSYQYWQDESRAQSLREAFFRYEAILQQVPGVASLRVPQTSDETLWVQFLNSRPVVAYLALLEGLKASVYTLEREALLMLNGQFDVPYFRPNKFIVYNHPEAQMVPAGLSFRSRIGIGLTSTRIKPSFSGRGVSPNADSATASFNLFADGRMIPPGMDAGVQRYEAQVSIPRNDGNMEVFSIQDEFIVRRPEIVISSPGVQVLYRNCQNVLDIDVPALAAAYQPSIEASDASVERLSDSLPRFGIAPLGDSCALTVNSRAADSTVLIGELLYQVIEPPRPSIQLLVNEQLHNGFSLIPRTSQLLLRLIPDPAFSRAFPADARYGITTIDVMIQRDLGTPDVVRTINGLTREAIKGIPIDLGPEVAKAFPGTAIYLRINQIFRKNFEGKDLEETRFTESERIIGLVVR